VRQVEPGVHGGTTRRGQGAHVIVNDGVGVESQPLLHPGKPQGKVKTGTTEAGIVSALFLCQAHIAEAGEAVPERPEGERHMTFSGEDDHPGKTELQVPARLEAEFFRVDPRSVGVTMALQRAKQTFVAKWP
jgi:hypothetical protein